MFALMGHQHPGTGHTPNQRIPRRPRRAALVTAWLAVLAVYAICGGAVPAYAAKLPTVTSVTPSSGPGTGGTAVTIEGTNFKNVKAVKFGSSSAASFTVNSATSITATSPAGAVGTVDVTVTVSGNKTSAVTPADHYEFTPTVTGVSPNTGIVAGGTPVTITGSGFAVGASATRITFGDIENEIVQEAVGVNCPTTTECTATTPELSEQQQHALGATLDVRATVNSVVSPETAADQFHYHGLVYVRELNGPRIEEAVMRAIAEGRETSGCNAFVIGQLLGTNGQATADIVSQPFSFQACFQEDWFGELPFSFTVHLSEDGSATVEGPIGVRNDFGCVYEGSGMTGSFEVDSPLRVTLAATLTFVREEIPEAGCAATETVSTFVGAERFSPAIELVG